MAMPRQRQPHHGADAQCRRACARGCDSHWAGQPNVAATEVATTQVTITCAHNHADGHVCAHRIVATDPRRARARNHGAAARNCRPPTQRNTRCDIAHAITRSLITRVRSITRHNKHATLRALLHVTQRLHALLTAYTRVAASSMLPHRAHTRALLRRSNTHTRLLQHSTLHALLHIHVLRGAHLCTPHYSCCARIHLLLAACLLARNTQQQRSTHAARAATQHERAN